MCTYQTERVEVSGSGKGAAGWFPLRLASVYFNLHNYLGNVTVAEIRTGKDDFVLRCEEHQLHVNDAVAKLVTHRNAGGLELIEYRLIHRKLQISARLND